MNNPATPAPANPGSWITRQPFSGAVGLAFVSLAVALLGFLPGQVEPLTTTIAIATFGLPVLVAFTLWWNNWPLQSLSRMTRGITFLLLFALGSAGLALVGQAITGRMDPGGLLGLPDAFPVFPYGFVLAATVFVVMLQITFVWNGAPFRRLAPISAGLAAIATAWAVGLVLYFALLSWVPPDGMSGPPAPPTATFGTFYALAWPDLLLCVVVVQIVCFMLLQGWPVSLIRHPLGYWLAANVASIGGGLLLLAGAKQLGISSPVLSATCGCITAACLVQGMLFETWPFQRLSQAWQRTGLVAGMLIVAAAIYALLAQFGSPGYPASPAVPPLELWITGVALNLVASSVIIHCAIFGRWPLPASAR